MKETISKFAAPIVFTLIGLVILITGGAQGQNSMVLIGGAVFTLIGIVALLNALSIIKNALSTGVIVVMLILSVLLGYFNYDSIKRPIEFNEKKSEIYAEVVQRLKDIREAQVAYKKEYGKYAGNFDTLINFLKNDSISVVSMMGFVPDTLTESEALELGIISRDTTRIPAFESVYHEEYLKTRFKKVALAADSLPKVPKSNNEFAMETDMVERNNVLVPVFEVRDPEPFDPKEPMIVGSLEDPRTAGNWKEEK